MTFNNDNDAHPGWVAQDDKAVSAITALNDTFGIVDLTAAYASQGGPHPPVGPAKSVVRGFAFTPLFDTLFVVDEIDFTAAANVTWGMHLRKVTFKAASDGRSAVLTSEGGQTLHARVLEPATATLAWQAPRPPPPQDSLAGVNKLAVTVPTGDTRIVVALSPNDIPASVTAPGALAEWPTHGPFAQHVY